jgi:hypothetical protein
MLLYLVLKTMGKMRWQNIGPENVRDVIRRYMKERRLTEDCDCDCDEQGNEMEEQHV